MARFPESDHCDGERFFSPWASTDRGLKELREWRRRRQRSGWPDHVPLARHEPPPAVVERGKIAVTFIGHSTFVLRTSDAVIITDPVFTTHAGPFGRLGPRRVRPPAIPLEDLPAIDVALVSHSHYDHLQPSSLRAIARRGSPAFVTSLGLRPYLEGLGLPRVTDLDWWEATDVGGARVTGVPAQHFSARTPWDRNRTLWSGFVVESGDATVYFAADSGYCPAFAEIGRRFPRIDVALIPIGAYEPRWFMQPLHVNPEEAVRIHLDVAPRVSVGMHFGTFQLTDEAIDEPLRALERARAARGVPAEAFRTLDFGETLVF